jgi:hypothetical protein
VKAELGAILHRLGRWRALALGAEPLYAAFLPGIRAISGLARDLVYWPATLLGEAGMLWLRLQPEVIRIGRAGSMLR